MRAVLQSNLLAASSSAQLPNKVSLFHLVAMLNQKCTARFCLALIVDGSLTERNVTGCFVPGRDAIPKINPRVDPNPSHSNVLQSSVDIVVFLWLRQFQWDRTNPSIP